MSSYFRLLLLLSALTMVGPLAIDAYLPSFSAIRQDLKTDEVMVQQTLGLFLFAFAGMMLFYGTLSDAFGRRKVILVSLAVYTLASLGAALSPSIEWLLFFRVLQGLGSGGGTVVSRAIVRDLFKGAEAQRMMSHMTMVFGLAPAIAPILGGWLQVLLGWRWVFGFSVLFGALMLVLVWRHLPESLPQEQRQPFHPRAIVAQYISCLRHPRFVLLILMLATAFAGFSLYIGSASHFIMDILHLKETDFGWMFIPLVGGLISGSAIASRLAHRLSRRTFVQTAFIIMAVAAIFNVSYNLMQGSEVRIPWAVLPLFIYSFGLSFLTPAVTMGAMDFFPHNQGLASSLQSFTQMVVFATMAGVVVPLLFGSGLYLALGMAGMAIASLVFYILFRVLHDRAAPPALPPASSR